MEILDAYMDVREMATVDTDPALLLLEIAEGNEELNTELFRGEFIRRADEALTKSIELDGQIMANGLASKGTVAYGIEALDITATFLGVNYDGDTVAAGIEDDDQETPKEEKKGFLSKVRDAASHVWETIIGVINKIITKVTEFFSSKAIEQAEKELDTAADKVEKETGSEDAKPKCDEKNLEKHAVKVAKKAPLFVKEHGIKSAKDLNELFDFILDKESAKSIQQFGKILSSDFKDYINDLNDAISNSKNGSKDEKKLKDDLKKAGLTFLHEYKINEFKQHPLKEKIIKEHEKDIIKKAKLKNVKEVEYNILYISSDLEEKKGDKSYIKLECLVVYKNISAMKRLDKLDVKPKNISSYVNLINSIVGNETVTIKIPFKASEIAKMIEPMSSKELKQIKEDASRVKKLVKSDGDEIKKITTKAKDSVKKMETKLKALGDVGANMYTIVNDITSAISKKTKSTISNAPGVFKNIVNAEINLATKCEGKPTGKPFSE